MSLATIMPQTPCGLYLLVGGAAPSQLETSSSFPALTFALQALLARHEAYMASAERDRVDMQTRIEQLETDKRSLEAENARTIEENRALLDQLEQLNNIAVDAETRMRSLEATLQSSQQSIRRLEGAEARAADMERHIGLLEAEQATLQNTLIGTESEARSAMQRWRKAERGVNDLQEQLERIERETREERERHVEVLDRMERQRTMERELNTAAGRLKGAAASKTLHEGRAGGSVVSHFVRDLLQDNASLQLGMAELREMLMNSNDEIQQLREQLMFHQPVEGETSATSTLRAELEPEEAASPERPKPTATISQELHIHHHYHVTKPAEPKKPKKKRQIINPGIFAPLNTTFSSPQSGGHWQLSQGSPAPAVVSHAPRDSLSTAAPSTRWSVFSQAPSDFAPSSVPSSPISNARGSVFEHGNYDPSTPVSPITSVDPLSPAWTRQHRKRNSDMSTRNFHTPMSMFLGDLPEHDSRPDTPVSPGSRPSTKPPVHEDLSSPDASDNIPELTIAGPTTDDSTEASTSTSTADHQDEAFRNTSLSPSFDNAFQDDGMLRRRLHRAGSHESVISLSGGLDIHTLKDRPSQLSIRLLGAASADTGLSSVSARPTISRGHAEGKRSSMVLRENLVGLPTSRTSNRAVTGPVASSPLASRGAQRQSSAMGLGKLVGWRPWASSGSQGSTSSAAPSERSRSMSPNPAPQQQQTQSDSTGSPIQIAKNRAETSTAQQKLLKEKAFSPRPPGINQPGAIPGFQEYWASHQRRGPPTQVTPAAVDIEALREGLEDG